MDRDSAARAERLPPAEPPSGRGLWLRWGVAAGGFALAVLAAEAMARFVYRSPWWDSLLGQQMLAERIAYRRNRQGFRDSDYGTPKPAGTRRVLLLGDSFTFGLGVSDDEKIFPELLERELNGGAGPSEQPRIEVLNGAVSGSYVWDWIQVWKTVGTAFEPDVVLIVYFLRDGTHLHLNREFFDRIRIEVAERNTASWLYRSLALYRLFRDGLDRRQIGSEYARAFHEAYFGEHQASGWRRAKRSLRKLVRAIRSHGAIAGFVVFPVLVQLDESYPFREISREVVRYAGSLGLPVHDLLPDFLGRDATSLWVSPFNQHPNEKAHALVAEALLPFVRQLLAEAEMAQPEPANSVGVSSRGVSNRGGSKNDAGSRTTSRSVAIHSPRSPAR
jgi:lysophospholipase L1-like esterase